MTIALGGVWDESAIRGLPISFRSPEAGRIVRGLLDARVRNPVMVLDEIDKVGGATKSFGDPSAALLEMLDPEQNTHFRDVYVGVAFDLSEVLFIATANDLAGIPAPLRDRLEVIEASGYSDDEKVAIVRRRLWADQLEVNGLNAGAFWTGTPAVTRGEPDAPAAAALGCRPPVVEVIEGELTAVTRPGEGRPSPPPPAGGRRRGDGCGDPGSDPRPHLRGRGARARAAARRRRPVRGVPPGGAGRHRPGHRRRRRRRGCAPRPDRRVHITVAEVLGPPRYGSLPDHVRDALSRERARVTGLQPADPAAVAAAAWIEVLEELPWRRAEERLGAPASLRRAFDREHVGRDREKDQVVDHLVARRADARRHAAGAPADDAVILCLCGPPGIGRTAFARALAAALGRRFVRVSLAGVQDAAAVHGVARPAPDAAPGRLVRALRGLGPLPGRIGDNPLVVLGELDRLAEAAADAAARRARPRAQPRLPGPLRRPAAGPEGHAVRRDRDRPGAHPAAAAGTARAVVVGRLHGRGEGTHRGRAPDLGRTPAARVVRRRPVLLASGPRAPDLRLFARTGRARPRRAHRRDLPQRGAVADRGPAAARRDDARDGGGLARRAAVPRRAGCRADPPARGRRGSGRHGEGRRGAGRRGGVPARPRPVARHRNSRAAAAGVGRRRADVGARERGTPRRRRRARRLDGRARAPGRGRPVEGRRVGGGGAGRRPGLGAHRPAARGDVAMSGELTLAGTIEPVGGIREKVLGACRAGMTAVVLPRGNEADIAESFGDEPPRGIRVCYARTMDDVLEVVLPGVVAANTAQPLEHE